MQILSTKTNKCVTDNKASDSLQDFHEAGLSVQDFHEAVRQFIYSLNLDQLNPFSDIEKGNSSCLDCCGSVYLICSTVDTFFEEVLSNSEDDEDVYRTHKEKIYIRYIN